MHLPAGASEKMRHIIIQTSFVLKYSRIAMRVCPTIKIGIFLKFHISLEQFPFINPYFLSAFVHGEPSLNRSRIADCFL